MPASDGHYKSFSKVYGTPTETHRPSSTKRTGKAKTLPFIASIQHVRNVFLMVKCEECAMWWLLYAPLKLSSIARQQLKSLLEDYTFILYRCVQRFLTCLLCQLVTGLHSRVHVVCYLNMPLMSISVWFTQ